MTTTIYPFAQSYHQPNNQSALSILVPGSLPSWDPSSLSRYPVIEAISDRFQMIKEAQATPKPVHTEIPDAEKLGNHTVKPLPKHDVTAARTGSLQDDIASMALLGTFGTVVAAESFRYFVLQKGAPKKAAQAAPVIEMPAQYNSYRDQIERLKAELFSCPARDIQKRTKLAEEIAELINQQGQTYLKDLQSASTPEEKVAILKAIATDFEILYRINQIIWSAHYSTEFSTNFAAFSRLYYESENSPFKRLPQLGVATINNFITLAISLTCCVAMDLSYEQLHQILPGLFYEYETDFSYLNWDKIADKIYNFLFWGGIYNWLFYYGKTGFYSMNAKGEIAKLWNQAAARVGIVATPMYWGAAQLDKAGHGIFGSAWETPASGIRIFYSEGLFGFTKYVKYTLPELGGTIGTCLEMVVGSANTVLNAVLFNADASLTLAEKFAVATRKPVKFVFDQIAPSFILNFIRAAAQTKISQDPRNDPATAQILRTVNGAIISGGPFYAINSHRDAMSAALFYLAQFGLGRATHFFADLTANQGLRDRFALWAAKLRGK